MRNLALDFGNTRIKAGTFSSGVLEEAKTFSVDELKQFISNTSWDNAIISSVSQEANEILQLLRVRGKKILLNHSTPLPISLLYRTPQTLGVDRIAAACGAGELFPNRHALAIDAGTCINYELIDDKGNYHGGAISPGISMRFEAMHTFTAKLPLVMPVANAPLLGVDTLTCMQSGVMNGVWFEINEVIRQYQSLYPNLGVVLCGGDHHLFEKKLNPFIFVAPNLVLMGLNRILTHNAG